MSEGSGFSDDLDDLPMPAVPVPKKVKVSAVGDLPKPDLPVPKKEKVSVAIRQTVTSEKLSVLVASHTNHYAVWSQGRKKSGRQLLPAEVWAKVRESFVVAIIYRINLLGIR